MGNSFLWKRMNRRLSPRHSEFETQNRKFETELQLVFALGVEKLICAVVIGFRHKDFGETIQIAVFGQARVHEFLRGDDAVLFEHDDEHLGIDDGSGVEKLHATTLPRHVAPKQAKAECTWIRRINRTETGQDAFTRIPQIPTNYGARIGICRRLAATPE